MFIVKSHKNTIYRTKQILLINVFWLPISSFQQQIFIYYGFPYRKLYENHQKEWKDLLLVNCNKKYPKQVVFLF